MDTPTLHEDHTRWRDDDGGEAAGGATFLELEDTAHEFDSALGELDVNVRLRSAFHVEVANVGGGGVGLQLQYNLNSVGWNDVNAASLVARTATSANFTDGDDTTEHGVTFVGSGSFHTPNQGMEDGNGVTGNETVTAQDFYAVEHCFQLREVDLADGDVVEFRLVTQLGALLDTYPTTDATANITIPAPAPGEPWIPAYIRRQQLIPSVTR